jgi:uncharacterized glyoxalase superfamily protein PhnB
MTQRVSPMIHVPDVQATVNWYEAIGFTTLDVGEVCGEVVFARLSFGDGQLMLSSGGQPSSAVRREVDLYVQTDQVDELYVKLKGRVTVQAEPHDTFYGMREFIIRDCNGFWVTFGQRGEQK